MKLADEIARISRELRSLAHGFAIVGGLAVSTRAEPRLTLDVDIAVAVQTDDEAEQLVHTLVQRGFQVIAAVEQVETGRLGTVRLRHAEAGASLVDLLFASCGIESEIVGAATPTEIIPGLVVPVACVGDLIAMKLLSRDDRRRPADADDLKALSEIAHEEDWARAEWAVATMEERLANRDRDLRGALRELRERGAY